MSKPVQSLELASPPETIVFQLEVSMKADHLTAVRRFVADLAQSVVRDADLASRLAMAAHELLENAIKYAQNRERLVTLQLCAESDRKVHVTVRNVSSEELVAPLRERLQALADAKDPVAHYYQLISSSMQSDTGSGLGLARIRAEGNMELSCELSGDILAVRAQSIVGDWQ